MRHGNMLDYSELLTDRATYRMEKRKKDGRLCVLTVIGLVVLFGLAFWIGAIREDERLDVVEAGHAEINAEIITER